MCSILPSADEAACRISGRVSGSNEIRHLVFRSEKLRRDVWVWNGCYQTELEPGRYAVSYRTFNNVLRLISDIEVTQAGEFDLHYDSPTMTVKVRNLPAGVLGGEVYVRSARGCSSRHVERLDRFDLNFEGSPDLSREMFHQLEINAGYRGRRFQFRAEIGGTLEIDFAAPERAA